MLQGAAYCSRPLYGHSHYKKFWLKKMETENEQARFLEPDPGIFWKGKSSSSSSLDVSLSSNDMNFSPLEIKGSGRSGNGVSSLRSGRQEFPSFENEDREGIFDCALSIGMQTPSEEEREGEGKCEMESFVRNLQEGKNNMGIHKLRIHSLKRLLHSDGGDSQTEGEEKMTEIVEFREGTAAGRTCSDCKTNRTPLWRNGPNGPKSLCNACGIRYKKIGKRSGNDRQKSPTKFPASVHRLTKLNKRKQDNDTSPPSKRSNATFSSADNTVARHDPYLNKGVPRHDENDSFERIRSFGKDEEEGAVLLMGLSCGLVNA